MNREVLDRRRARVVAAWKNAGLTREIVMVCAGQPIGIPGGADQTYPFIAHSDYHYLTDLDAPGGVLCYDPQDEAAGGDGWRHFILEVTEAEQMWEGRRPIDFDALRAEGERVEPREALSAYVLSFMRGKREAIVIGPVDRHIEDQLRSSETWEALRDRYQLHLQHARRVKDDEELARIRTAIDVTEKAFAAARRFVKPGVTERRIQIEMEAEMFRVGGAGAKRTAYGSIVGAGSNAAVLHFAPSDREVSDGDFVLIDAGVEYRRYAADVTRTYPAGVEEGKKFLPHQQELFDVVRRAQQNAIARCVVGAEWKDIHLAAAAEMVDGLVGMGLMRGKGEELVEREAHMLFFPHGLGHMVGLGVRDASGMLPGRPKSTRACLKNLRMDLPLEAGYVVTVEPGLYFVPAILNDAGRREKYADCVDWAKVDWWLDALPHGGGGGGVRLEENVLVRASGGPEVLTSEIPHE